MKSFLLAALVVVAALSGTVAHAIETIEYETIGPFDASKLPGGISGLELKNIENLAANDSVRPSLVVAVSESGTAKTVWGKSWRTQDRIRQALQLCEHVSQSACGLAVVDGKLVRFGLLPRQLTYSERFDAEAVPFMKREAIQHFRSKYANARRPRALALNWNGAWGTWTGVGSEYSARLGALSWCRKSSGNAGNCFLYDVNGRVVFGPETDIYGDQ